MRCLALVLIGIFAFLAACTSAPMRGSSDTPDDVPFDRAVEVVSDAAYPVVVKYYGNRGVGPVWLGEVSPGGRARFVLPDEPVSVIFAETVDGRRVASDRRRTSRLVRFRRIPAD